MTRPRARRYVKPSDILKDTSIDPLQRLLLYLHHPSNPDLNINLGRFQLNGIDIIRFDYIRLENDNFIWVTLYADDDLFPEESSVTIDQSHLQLFLDRCIQILDHDSSVDLLTYL